jgi:(2R)-3-sulfolactate dehydrogenase (NADP+)
MPDQIRIEHERLVALIAQVLANLGVRSPACTIEAEVMVEADLLGVPSHGVRTLPMLVRALKEGRANANPPLKITRERAATCVIDGDNGIGRYVSVQAMQHAVAHAKTFGVGVCLANRVTHWGRAHAYAYRAAQAGCIGICTTNAIPNMLAWNSKLPLLGNNPLAIGVPRGNRDPVVLDMAMSQAAIGKVGTYLREGKAAPLNWGLDVDGNPTSDPASILASRRMLPFGDHKGVGLAVMLELVTGALAGGLLSQEIVKRDATGLDADSTKLFIALDVAAFVDPARLSQRIDDLLAYLRDAEPGLQIDYPGDRGWQTRARYLADGIPLHSEIVEQLKTIGVRL